MRIVLTTESYLPYVSGVTVSVDALARGLGARGHEVLLVAPRPAGGTAPMPVGSPGPEPSYAWLSSYQLPRIVPAGYRMALPALLGGSWRTARKFRPEVVHAHSPFVTGILARRLARAEKVPLVFTHHTRFTDYGHYLGPLAGPGTAVTDAFLRAFWLGCAAIIAPSQGLAAEIRGRLPEASNDRVSVIPTGIDVAGIQALEPIDPRPDAGWMATARVVATLGRLAPEKSVDEVLEAFTTVADRERDARLLVVGGGPAEAALRTRASAPDLTGRVLFTGALPRLEALARLAGGQVFVFASRTETQGLVLAEALAAGLPAVAIDGPGVRDSIRDGVDGIVVPMEPSEDRAKRLGDAVAQILGDDGARERMSRRAREEADRFAVGSRVAEVEALYGSLIR